MRGEARSEANARRCYGLLLWLYPRAFRERYRRDMTETFLAAWRAAGVLHRRRHWFWLRTLIDVSMQGIGERMSMEEPRERRLGGVAGDVRHGVRSALRSPGFAVLVSVTLALGIGVNVAVFSLIDAVVLNPLPVHEPARLVAVYEALNARSLRGGVAYPTYRDLSTARTGLTSLAASVEQFAELRVSGEALRVSAGMVSGNYFDVLGVRAARGRVLVPADEAAPGETPVVVLSHDLWQSRFGGDESVTGRTIDISGGAFTVVGVAPRGFRGVDLTAAPDLWIPITMAASISGDGLFAHEDALTTRSFNILRLVGRLAPGMTHASAAEALNRARRAAHVESLAEDVAQPMSVLPLLEAAAIGNRTDLLRFLALLACVAGLTLLVACVNVANLLVVRARQRSRELSVRAALGAGRARLFRQLLLESLILVIPACILALAVAQVTIGLLAGFTLPGEIAVDRTGLRLDARALSAAVVLALSTFALFGTLPAARASRESALGTLRSRGGRTRRSQRPWDVLVSAQSGLSVLLLVGAALFARTLQEALRADLGMRADSVVALSIALRPHGLPTDEAVSFIAGVLDEARATTGIGGAAFALHVPLAPRGMALPLEAKDDSEAGRVQMNINVIAGDYFDVLGIRLIAGRVFDERDRADGEKVVVLNASAARQLWAGGNALGRRVQLFPPWGAEATVVGIVADSRYHTVSDRDVPYAFYPFAQQVGTALDHGSILARGSHGAGAALDVLTATLRRRDPTLPLFDLRHVDRQIDTVLAPQRFGATLLGVFSLLALAIAGVGVYGVAAHVVALERRDIGIRMALGAHARGVIRQVLARTLLATMAGALGGIALAALLTRLLEGFLYGVTPLDPAAFAAALGALILASLIAAALPAHRAASVDPARTLRADS